jgi:ribosomal-protein-alanine N-acetyltransferase
MEIKIRKLDTSELEAADGILQAAFLPPMSRIQELRRCVALQPDGWRLAEMDGQAVGIVGSVDYGAFAWIGSMAVLPEFQNRGIGRALMNDILAWLDDRGCPMVRLDASDAGAILYHKLGFMGRGQVLSFVLEAKVPIRTLEVCVSLLRAVDIPAAADFDELVFGARRECMFELLVTDFPQRAFISHDQAGRVTGYLFAQAQKIGPWAAQEPVAALALLARAVSLEYEVAPRIITPEENGEAAELLIRSGFALRHPHLHMCRGGSGLPGRRDLIYGQASYGVG